MHPSCVASVPAMERIRFHFDPRCPWCYQTSRWACRLEALGEVEIDWAVFSLEVVNLPGAFGVPTIGLDGGDGPAIFGPVVYKLPADDECVELWRHTAWLVRNENFAELKRGRGGVPDLPSIEWRMQQRAAEKK